MIAVLLLNQACAGCRPAHTWFLKIVSVWTSVCVFVYVCVCPLPRLLITSGMIFTLYDWLNKFYSFYRAEVIVGSGCGLRIKARCGN